MDHLCLYYNECFKRASKAKSKGLGSGGGSVFTLKHKMSRDIMVSRTYS